MPARSRTGAAATALGGALVAALLAALPAAQAEDLASRNVDAETRSCFAQSPENEWAEACRVASEVLYWRVLNTPEADTLDPVSRTYFFTNALGAAWYAAETYLADAGDGARTVVDPEAFCVHALAVWDLHETYLEPHIESLDLDDDAQFDAYNYAADAGLDAVSRLRDARFEYCAE